MQFTLSLPAWAIIENQNLPATLPTLEARMREVIRFSRLNFENNTGGPFAAGIFELETGKPVVIGVNRVVPMNCSSAHAEVMTLSLAQHILSTWDLGGAGLPAYQFVVNWRPCVMCYGATIWSGIRSMAIAGSGPELESITGFDEGPIHPQWDKELEKRGIEVIDKVLNAEAVGVFHAFAASGAVVYNGRQGG
jgi:tRNA(Arg) A34 adenosine deaminase TadA